MRHVSNTYGGTAMKTVSEKNCIGFGKAVVVLLYAVMLLTTASAAYAAGDGSLVRSGTYGPFLDASGQIETRIHYKVFLGHNISGIVAVSSDEVLIGGGARIWGGDALLVGSYPYLTSNAADNRIDSNGNPQNFARRWVGQSRSQTDSSPPQHYLFVQAIGMKLRKNIDPWHVEGDPIPYMTRNEMLDYMVYTKYMSATSGYTRTADAVPPFGYSLISGGGRVVDPFDRQNYLTRSHVLYDERSGRYYWSVTARENGTNSKSKVEAFSIAVIENNGYDGFGGGAIPDFGNFNIKICQKPADCINTDWDYERLYYPNGMDGLVKYEQAIYKYSHWDLSSYADFTSRMALPYLYQQEGKPVLWTTSGIGGSTLYSGNGRFLTGFAFNSDGNGGFITDKQGSSPNDGYLGGQVIYIVKDSGDAFWDPLNNR